MTATAMAELERVIGPAERDVLRRHGFDEHRFTEQSARLCREGLAGWSNTVTGAVRAPRAGEVPALPAPGSDDRRRLEALGESAIAAGRVASVVLNGGMATRFGGLVKAGVDALPGRSFLDLKLADARATERRTGGRVPVWLMNSFATDDETRRLLRALGADHVGTFTQFVSVRLTPTGDPFLEDDGRVSLYAPGHGDLIDAMRAPPMETARGGTLAKLRAEGVRCFVMSNVDNLAAGVSPAIVGHHLAVGAEITVEVARKEAGDKGGGPAWVDEKLEIVESFRLPAGFDEGSIPVFNTNTFVLDLEAVDRTFDLDYFAVQKKVDGRPAVQFERLAGQLTSFLRTAVLEVPRTGPDGRFLPAKDPDELARRRRDIEEILSARGAL